MAAQVRVGRARAWPTSRRARRAAPAPAPDRPTAVESACDGRPATLRPARRAVGGVGARPRSRAAAGCRPRCAAAARRRAPRSSSSPVVRSQACGPGVEVARAGRASRRRVRSASSALPSAWCGDVVAQPGQEHVVAEVQGELAQHRRALGVGDAVEVGQRAARRRRRRCRRPDGSRAGGRRRSPTTCGRCRSRPSACSPVTRWPRYSANDSLSHRSSHQRIVTRSPNHMCAISCAIVIARSSRSDVGDPRAEDVACRAASRSPGSPSRRR